MIEETINNIYEFLDNKEILILGYGREGKSTFDFIRKRYKNKKLYILDYQKIHNTNIENVEIFVDNEYEKYLNKYDLIIKSPGVSIKRELYEQYKDKITSQTSLFLKYAHNPIIGITGTKGKSTTSSLVYHVLKNNGLNCMLVGNIGIPIFSEIDDIKDDTILVFEMSSHQLQYIDKSPRISVLLNIYEEHLDYYESFEEYIYAKENIYRFQEKDDLLIYNGSCNNIDVNKILKCNQRKIPVYLNKENINELNYINIKDNELVLCFNREKTILKYVEIATNLKGSHNLYNISVVIAVCWELGIEIKDILKSIATFKGLEHRIEFVGKYNDINFYNDSIATIPEATMCAIKSFDKVDTIIIGGKDRGVNYSELVVFLDKTPIGKVLFIGESGKKIYEMTAKDNNKYIYAENLETAVELSKKYTPKNGICILSPASASFGDFKNFEERGNKFKELIKK